MNVMHACALHHVQAYTRNLTQVGLLQRIPQYIRYAWPAGFHSCDDENTKECMRPPIVECGEAMKLSVD